MIRDSFKPMPPECECANLLAAGAYTGWWCPLHKDVTPAPYAVEAVKLVNERAHGVGASDEKGLG